MKKNILSLGLGLCLMLALSVSTSAAEYTFEGVENKEFYHSTSYSAMYGSNYNYGGINVLILPALNRTEKRALAEKMSVLFYVAWGKARAVRRRRADLQKRGEQAWKSS